MNEPIDASIIIRTKNEEFGLPVLLKSLQNQITTYKYEIIIIDSGSTDETLSVAKEWKCKIIQINPDDFTYGYSLNKAVNYANGTYIIFLSAHTYPLSNYWLKDLLDGFNDERIIATYGRLIGDKNRNFFEYDLYNTFFSEKEMVWKNKNESSKINLSNSNAAYKKVYLMKYKFDEKIPYAEDSLFAQQIIINGFQIHYIPSASLYHSHTYNIKSNFLINFKSGYSYEYINFFLYEKKIKFIIIILSQIKELIFDSAYYLNKIFREKYFFTLRYIIGFVLSKFIGRTIGRLQFYYRIKLYHKTLL